MKRSEFRDERNCKKSCFSSRGERSAIVFGSTLELHVVSSGFEFGDSSIKTYKRQSSALMSLNQW